MNDQHDPDARHLDDRLGAWFLAEARPMPPAVLDEILDTVPRTSQRSRTGWSRSGHSGRLLLGVGLAGAMTLVAFLAGPQIVTRWLQGPGSEAGARPGCVPAPRELTAWWPGEGSGLDLVGANAVTLSGGATFAPGLVGRAFAMAGADDFAFAPHGDGLDVGLGDFTIMLWVRLDDVTGEQVLAEKWVQRFGAASTGWTLTKLESGLVGFYTEAAAGGTGVDSGSRTLAPGRWTLVTATRSNGRVDLYLDAELVGSQSGTPPGFDLDNPASLKLGHRGSASDTPGSEDIRGFFLHGQLDEVQLFVGRALDPAEIMRLYAAGANGECAP